MYPETYNTSRYHRFERRKRCSPDDMFICRRCQALVNTFPMISGVHNRNHCPYCLWSRHVDHIQAGDRMSACKANMQPIGLTVKQSHNKYVMVSKGELMLIHRCNDCGKLSINRIAADDDTDSLLETYRNSLSLDEATRNALKVSGIYLLQSADATLVVGQLNGIYRYI